MHIATELAKDNMFCGQVTPGKRFPRVRKEGDAYLVGYNGRPGCFLFQTEDTYDAMRITMFKGTPKSVVCSLRSGALPDSNTMSIPTHNGWGFSAIHALKAVLAQ